MTFDYQSSVARKNPDTAVRCFIEAFGSGRRAADVLLVVKTHSSVHDQAGARLFNDLAEKHRNIHIIDRDFSRSEMGQLQSACDAYLSPHRSEGFGLNLAECMAHGKPVVATGFSGNLDFMTEENSFLAPMEARACQKGRIPSSREAVLGGARSRLFRRDHAAARFRSSPRLSRGSDGEGRHRPAPVAEGDRRMIKKNLLDL